MKGFLLDENLPAKLTFVPDLPVCSSRELGRGAGDGELWDFAAVHSLVIVTKDADFSHRIMQASPPPWIVHLRFGNMSRAAFHARLAGVWPHIVALLPEHKLVCVYHDRLESFSEL